MNKKILIIILFLSGCTRIENNINNLSYYEIFTQNKIDYYVLFYLNGCVACRDVRLRINHMEGNLFDKFYYVDIEKNREILSDKFVSNVGVSNYMEIKIKKVPTLILIKEKLIVDEWVKSEVILNYFNFLENRFQR